MKQNWTYKKFEDCLDKVKYTPKVPSSDYMDDGAFPIISQEEGLISGYWNKETDVFKVLKPVVIFGDHTRILKYVDFDFVLGADGVKILQPIEGLSAKFLLYYLIWCNIPSMGYSRHYKLLKELDIPVPPIETQSRIVSELDLLQSIIDKQQAQLKELDTLAQAVFYDMFGDPVENEKGWEVKRLGEVCTFLQGEQVPVEEQFFEKKDGTIRFLRIVDFTQGNEEPRYVYCKDEKHILHDKEIAIVRYGTPGFVCYGKFGLIANNLFKIVPKNNNYFDFRYLVSWLESSAFQSTVQGNQYGAALQAIKFGTIQNINIIIPPLSLQQSFSAKIESIEKQKATISQSMAETQKLFDYTMDKYFG